MAAEVPQHLLKMKQKNSYHGNVIFVSANLGGRQVKIKMLLEKEARYFFLSGIFLYKSISTLDSAFCVVRVEKTSHSPQLLLKC